MSAPRRKPKARTRVCWLVVRRSTGDAECSYAGKQRAFAIEDWQATPEDKANWAIVRATYTLPKPRRGER